VTTPGPPARPLGLVLLLLVAVGLLAGCTDDGDAPPGDAAATSTTTFLTADALPVFVASRPIPAGTSAETALDEGWLQPDSVTRAQFPEDAVVSAELLEGTVASNDVGAGAIVTIGMFVSPSSPTSPVVTNPTLPPDATQPVP
jgi:hypothetical protein